MEAIQNFSSDSDEDSKCSIIFPAWTKDLALSEYRAEGMPYLFTNQTNSKINSAVDIESRVSK